MLHIIWDLDGTLIDSAADIIISLEFAISGAGLDKSMQVKPFVIGPTIKEMLIQAFPAEILSSEIIGTVIAIFRKTYDNSEFGRTCPYPGIEAIINDTAKFTHHIVTNKPDMPVNRILTRLNWAQYITSVNTPYTKAITSNVYMQSKRDIYADVIKQHSGATTSLFIGIGDMRTDCLAAKENGIRAAGVLWGYGNRDELSDCSDYIFEDTQSLSDFLCEWSSLQCKES